MDLRQALVFGILMANGQGPGSKSPDYIMEKLALCSMMPKPEGLLGAQNMAIFRQWTIRWGRAEQWLAEMQEGNPDGTAALEDVGFDHYPVEAEWDGR